MQHYLSYFLTLITFLMLAALILKKGLFFSKGYKSFAVKGYERNEMYRREVRDTEVHQHNA
ncbi:hypothetical protein A1QQ_01785 [Vibrio ordalii FF-167]|nr:hypothetical protein A1QQ_01785 [Vibrio ordalii FF-167]